MCRGFRWAAGFGAQQPVGPAVPSNLCDDLSWAQSHRRVLPCVIPVRLSVRPVPVWLACLAGRLGRGGPADPTNPTVFGRTHNWSTGDHTEGHVWQFGRRGPPGTAAAPRDGTSRGRLVLTPYHLRPARRLWLQVWVRVGCRGLNPC